MSLINELVSNEIKEEVKIYLETNENENTTIQSSSKKKTHSNTGLIENKTNIKLAI